MARGDHPQRTPFYGIAMMIGVMVVGAVVATTDVGKAVQIPVYTVLFIIGVLGAAMTFRDYSH
ncbi:hypothetical protein [Tomitella cavernea]|uniref:Uncharacterized protein n=1 Tax=Tomitella cavernea TaxID=1387982 RepID=A0ABP9C427_9ACTN|nr:hypothetical protein [Tomitella cavernea]